MPCSSNLLNKSKPEGASMIYQKSDFDQIIEKIKKPFPESKRTEFEDLLNKYATAFLQGFGAEGNDSPSEVVKQLKSIEKSAKALIGLTKLPDGSSAVVRLRHQAARYQEIRVIRQSSTSSGQHEEHITPSDYLSVELAIKAIKNIELYALAALADEKKKVGVDKKRHKGRKALQIFVNDLAGLWPNIFDEPPGTSVNPITHKAGGPFIRFTLACYEPLRNEYAMLPELDEQKVRYYYRESDVAKLKQNVKTSLEKSDLKKM